jgi:hypothetical protein
VLSLSVSMISILPKLTCACFLPIAFGPAAQGNMDVFARASPLSSPESPDGTGTVAGSSHSVLGAGLLAERCALSGVAGAEAEGLS